MNREGLKKSEIGEFFKGYCVIRNAELKYSQAGKPYLVLELGDRSGRLKGRLWNRAEEVFRSVSRGKIVKVRGRIQSLFDGKEILIEQISTVRRNEKVPLENLFPVSQKNIPRLKKRFQAHRESIRDQFLGKLLETVFPDEKSWERYWRTPAGKLWHHNYLYGVLEHVTCLLDLTDVIFKYYPSLRKDLLKCAIILRELGKMELFEKEPFIEYSTEGRLIGEVALTFLQVNRAMAKLEEFPVGLQRLLYHLLLSREQTQNRPEAIPVPMTLEAITLNLLDELDVRLNATQRIISHDRLPGQNWTRYNNLLDRFIYVGEKDEHQKRQE